MFPRELELNGYQVILHTRDLGECVQSCLDACAEVERTAYRIRCLQSVTGDGDDRRTISPQTTTRSELRRDGDRHTTCCFGKDSFRLGKQTDCVDDCCI